jgi:hypothetical protein
MHKAASVKSFVRDLTGKLPFKGKPSNKGSPAFFVFSV